MPTIESSATTCERHGVEDVAATLSLQIVSASGPRCFVCPADGAAGATVRQNWDLWRAAVSGTFELTRPDPAAVNDPFLKHHDWTSLEPDTLARHLRESKPRVLIACGKAPAEALHQLGVLPDSWNVAREEFARRSYCFPAAHSELTGESLVTFVTYTTSNRAVKEHASKLYDDTTGQRALARADELGMRESTETFMKAYGDPESHRCRGMQLLLLHWLEIGAAIRAMNG